MAELAEVWQQSLPVVRQSVTGVGVWSALNAAIPVLLEDNVAYFGLKTEDSELAGHLKLPNIRRLIETQISQRLDRPVTVRIIEGQTVHDVELVKRRDAERRRLQEAELQKMRQEMQSKSSWETVYEQLSRRFAATPNKSLPQNRARFYEEAVGIIAEARLSQATFDDAGERNFARCIERVAQYVDLPSTNVAVDILKRVGEL
jgi:hypothetical protein